MDDIILINDYFCSDRARTAAVLESNMAQQLDRGLDSLHTAQYVDDAHLVPQPNSAQGKILF